MRTSRNKVIALTDSLVDLAAQAQTMKSEAQFAELFEQAFPEKDLEALERQLKRIKQEAAAVLSSGNALNNNQMVDSQYNTEKDALTDEFQQVREGIESGPGNDEEKLRAIEQLNVIEKERLKDLERERDMRLQIAGAQDVMNEAIRAANEEQRLSLELGELQLTNRLRMEGMNSTQISHEVRKYRLVASFQKLIAKNPDRAEEFNKALERQLQLIGAIAKQQQAAANPMNRLMEEWKADLSDVNGYYAQMAQTVQQELGNAMASAITGVIDGTTTIQEALANMFKNIGQAFIQMATQMIAKALIMKVLGIPMGNMFGGGGMGGGGYYNPMTGVGTAGPNYGLAEGGFVDSPTNATIGEGGEPEYVIPQSKMDDSMARWNGGTRGNAVLDPVTGSGTGEGMGFDAGYNPNIVINGGVMSMGGEDYIKRSELPGIVGQAARSGEERALRKLRMSPSARKKIGL
ncbi:MAG: hypothetical protein P8J33_01290 [Pirellulaceae bacterium]|nr:hypothetical protein [Pirellulaceae bacterium]